MIPATLQAAVDHAHKAYVFARERLAELGEEAPPLRLHDGDGEDIELAYGFLTLSKYATNHLVQRIQEIETTR